MQHHIFTVFDQKAKAYLPPFFLPRPEMATRVFTDCVNDPTHQFGKNPADYTLLELGGYDDTTAEISPLEVPIVIGTGIQFVKSPKPESQYDES